MQDKGSDQKKPWRPPLKKLTLDLVEPQREEGSEVWEVVAIARVQMGNQPFSGASVQFSHQGNDIGLPVMTDGIGRAKKVFPDLGVGSHTISATLVETGVSVTDTIRLKKPDNSKQTLNLELQPAEKIGQEWLVRAVATVTTGNNPIANSEVQFYLQTISWDSPVTTEADGRANQEFVLDKPGRWVIEATCGALKRKVTINIPEDEKIVPVELVAQCLNTQNYGNYTKYITSWQVFSSKGEPIPNVTIRIFDSDLAEGFKDFPTDENGSAKYETRISGTEKRRVIEGQVLNHPKIHDFMSLYSNSGTT